MQPTATNGAATTARDMLDSLSQVIERLEAELKRHQQENAHLRAERDEARAMFNAMREFVRDLPEWENFNPNEYTCTTADILADLRAK